ncbi:MAG: hypothetical protein IPL49_14555 [Saprospirales bacterium]|nr:hypothetical protein [Saprospirales bacterium]
MHKLIMSVVFILCFMASGEVSAQSRKNKTGIAEGEMPALSSRDLKEFRKKPLKWWTENMLQSLYFQNGRRRDVQLLNLKTREDAYNVSDLGLVLKASEQIKAVLDEIPFLSNSKIEGWELSPNIQVDERVVKGFSPRMEFFRAEFGPLRGVFRTNLGMHSERLTLKELFGAKDADGISNVATTLLIGQRGYPLGGEAVLGMDVLQAVFGGRKFRIEAGGKNPWSFAASADLGYGLAFDLSNVYKLPEDWTLLEELVVQSLSELTPGDSQIERNIVKVAADLIIKDISIWKSPTSRVFETGFNFIAKKNLKPRLNGAAPRYRQLGGYISVGKSFYNPKSEGAPNYTVSYSGIGVFWKTFF